MEFANRPAFASTFLPDGTYPEVGQVFRNPDIAATLRTIGQKGKDGFYRGPVADAILKVSAENGGFMTASDLADFKPEWVTPVSTTYHGWTIYETPPNTQGIAAPCKAARAAKSSFSSIGAPAGKPSPFILSCKGVDKSPAAQEASAILRRMRASGNKSVTLVPRP